MARLLLDSIKNGAYAASDGLVLQGEGQELFLIFGFKSARF